jgi:prepilin-type N-terminal cleavage/methylation domain-containing protein
MQSRRHTAASRKTRRGFTLIELLVVISIIATLMSLILPAIQNAREAGRRTQCLNNIRNVTVATLNFASSNKSRLPALGYFPKNSSGNRFNGRSWAVELLPFMDQQGTYDRWNKDAAFNAAANNGLATNLYVEAFACPNDDSAYITAGGLSYVANAGFGDPAVIANDNGAVQHSFLQEQFDWDGDTIVNDIAAAPAVNDAEDTKITKATGVFWAEFEGGGLLAQTRNASASIGKIYDGSENTIMFGENINAGGESWADPRTRAVGFMFPLNRTLVDETTMINPTVAIAKNAGVNLPAYPNEAKIGPEGTSPYLNSNHPGIVVISMVGGSARTISENIDKGVYLQLITPDGTRLRSISGFLPENPLSGDSF